MLKSILKLSVRNAMRNRVRTGLTVGMVMMGVALLVVGTAWIDGVFNQAYRMGTNMAGHVRLATPGFSDNEALMPLWENMPETDSLVKALKELPNVSAVYPRITTGVTVTAGEEIGEFFALAAGAPESYFRKRLAGDENIVEGAWFSGKPDELVLGNKVAEQIGAGIGDEVVLLGVTQYGSMSPVKGTVVGITGGASPIYSRQVWLPLAKMQWQADIEAGATEILVFGEDFNVADGLADAIGAAGLGEGLAVEPWTVREPWMSMRSQIDGIKGTIMVFIIFLTSLGIWNTMMMSVLERTHEIGVLRAMGLNRLGTVGLFVIEALAIAIIGGGIGVGLGAIPAWLLETYGVHLGEKIVSQMAQNFPMSETVYGDLTADGMLTAFLMGLIMALAGSVIPALRAGSIQPVTAMRTGR